MTTEEGRRSSPTNILPPGEKTIPLPSGACQEKFHLSVNVPLIDETTARRRQVLTEHGFDSPHSHVLPKGEKAIRLPSGDCEDKFHVTANAAVALLQDSEH